MKRFQFEIGDHVYIDSGDAKYNGFITSREGDYYDIEFTDGSVGYNVLVMYVNLDTSMIHIISDMIAL